MNIHMLLCCCIVHSCLRNFAKVTGGFTLLLSSLETYTCVYVRRLGMGVAKLHRGPLQQ